MPTSRKKPKQLCKAKVGRPLKGAEPLTDSITVRLSEREKEVLLLYSWRYDVSPSDAVRFCLDVMGAI